MTVNCNAAHWREHLKQRRAELREQYQQDHKVEALLLKTSHMVDEILAGMWQQLEFPDSVALIAVGGYGRGHLFPCSDIDILILLPEQHDEQYSQKVETLIGLCWDVGLDIGHSVRTLHECLDESAKDLTVQTALLEARPLVCPPALFAQLRAALHAAMDPAAFLEAKLLEQQQRHARFHGVAYNLEPNIKESPGGLRDLNTITWISQACGLGSSWAELGHQGIVRSTEARQLQRAERVL